MKFQFFTCGTGYFRLQNVNLHRLELLKNVIMKEAVIKPVTMNRLSLRVIDELNVYQN